MLNLLLSDTYLTLRDAVHQSDSWGILVNKSKRDLVEQNNNNSLVILV